MINSLLEGLSYLANPALILAAIAAVILAQFISAMPGLGGSFLLAVMIPFLYTVDPIIAIAALIAASATDGTGNTVTSVVLGVPGSSTGVASVFDGHPMAKRGLAARAIGAGVTASSVGGIIGALFLVLLIPIVRPLVLAIGPAEFFILVLVALYAIAAIREESMIKGLIAGGLGLTISFIGQETGTGVLRYTFGQLYLWDGIQLIPLMIGLFAVVEMIDLVRSRSAISGEPTKKGQGALQGVLDVFRHWKATLSSSVVGLIVGILPGLGGSAAQFIAYSQAKAMSKEPEMFGKGSVEGVIAADAAVNSKEGGALVPTLAFGIPGSSGMAILLGAFVIFGVQPGPSMLEENLPLVFMMVFILVFANVFASGFVLLFSGAFVKITKLRPALIIAPVLVISVFGAYTTTGHLGDIWTMLIIGVFASFLKDYGYSRATFIIGFVLGPLLEHNFLLAMSLYGPSGFFTRPASVGLLAALLVGIVWSATVSYRRSKDRRSDAIERESNVGATGSGS